MPMNVYGPLDTGSVLTRIRAEVIALRKVDQAAELAAVIADPQAVTPAAFLLPSNERGEAANYSSGMVRHKVNVQLPIVLRVRNFRQGDLGTEAMAGLPAIRSALRMALIRFKPPEADLPISWVESRVIRYDASTVFSLEVFTTQYRIKVQS